jgi:uncharacterized RDD family membrane protein YckC
MESSGVAGTLGKWLRGIRVTSADGQGIPFVKALLRNLIKTVGILVIGLGVIRIIWNEQKQGWHDELVGSFVVAGK